MSAVIIVNQHLLVGKVSYGSVRSQHVSNKMFIRDDPCSVTVAYATSCPGTLDGANLSGRNGEFAGLNCQENRALKSPPIVVTWLANSKTFRRRGVLFVGAVYVNTKFVAVDHTASLDSKYAHGKRTIPE